MKIPVVVGLLALALGCETKPDPRCASLARQIAETKAKHAEVMASPAPADPQDAAWRTKEDLRLTSLAADLEKQRAELDCE